MVPLRYLLCNIRWKYPLVQNRIHGTKTLMRVAVSGIMSSSSVLNQYIYAMLRPSSLFILTLAINFGSGGTVLVLFLVLLQFCLQATVNLLLLLRLLVC